MAFSVRPTIVNVFSAFARPAVSAAEGDNLITVSPATKRIAFAYERFRNTLEPAEEDILRRKAIYRIIERRLFDERPPVATATALLQELIRAAYIKPIPVDAAEDLVSVLTVARQLAPQMPSAVWLWFLQLVAVSIDRHLYPRTADELLVRVMYEDVFRRAVWTAGLVKLTDRPVQLYIACHRTLFAADDFEIAYHYFEHDMREWRAAASSPDRLAALARALPAFRATMLERVNHPARDRLARLMRPIAVPYRVIREMAQLSSTGPASAEQLTTHTHDILASQIRKLRARMNKRAWNSIWFLFLTKTLIALMVEVPYERYFLQQVHWFALGINVIFHPVLLLLLATSARMPGARNMEKVTEYVHKIVTGDGALPTVIIGAPRQYGTITWSFFALFYAVLFMGIFWGLFTVLAMLEFSLLAMFLFIVFLGLVSFLSFRIRRAVENIRVLPRHEGAWASIFGFMTLPVLEFGRWLAQNVAKLNIPLILLDRVIEAPFKLLIDISEEWFGFVRERREEIA